MHPDPARDTSIFEELYRTYFGDPSGNHTVGGGASTSQGLEDEEESDPEEIEPASP